MSNLKHGKYVFRRAVWPAMFSLIITVIVPTLSLAEPMPTAEFIKRFAEPTITGLTLDFSNLGQGVTSGRYCTDYSVGYTLDETSDCQRDGRRLIMNVIFAEDEIKRLGAESSSYFEIVALPSDFAKPEIDAFETWLKTEPNAKASSACSDTAADPDILYKRAASFVDPSGVTGVVWLIVSRDKSGAVGETTAYKYSIIRTVGLGPGIPCLTGG